MRVRSRKLARRVLSAVLSGALGFGVMTAAAQVRQAYTDDPACATAACDGACAGAGAGPGSCEGEDCACLP